MLICLCVFIYVSVVKFEDDEEEKRESSLVRSQTVHVQVEFEQSRQQAGNYLASMFNNIDKSRPYNVVVQDIERNPNFIGYINE